MNPARAQLQAEILYKWGNAGFPSGEGPIKSMDEALALVRAKGQGFGIDGIEGLDADKARNDRAMGRYSDDVARASAAYRQFYGAPDPAVSTFTEAQTAMTGLQPRPVYPGPSPWSFVDGFGGGSPTTANQQLWMDTIQRVRLDEMARAEQRRQGLAAGLAPLDQPTGMGATPILGRATNALAEEQRRQLMLSGQIPMDAPTGMGATPILGRADNAISMEAERRAMLAGESPLDMPTGMGATPMLGGIRGEAANPQRIEQAILGGSPVVAGSGGATTATPDVPSASEAFARSITLDGVGDATAAAFDSAALLTNDPRASLSQAGPTVSTPAAPAGNAAERELQARRQGRRARRAANVTASAGPADAWLQADLGLGDAIDSGSRKLARQIPNTTAAGAVGRNLVRGGGKALAFGARALPFVGAAAPAVLGAIDGAQAGPGGAILQGGLGAAGTAAGAAIGTGIAGPFGTVIGGAIGGLIGQGLGGGATQVASGLVQQAQGGDTGIAGQIGSALDPLFSTPLEQESQAAIAQMNSPAMRALKQEQELRAAQARAEQVRAVYLQSLMA